MDRSEAHTALTSHLATIRQRSYADLVALMGDVHVETITGPSGVEYQIELEVIWDPPRERTNIMVMACIDDGRFLSALTPVTTSFILSPEGHFVGE